MDNNIILIGKIQNIIKEINKNYVLAWFLETKTKRRYMLQGDLKSFDNNIVYKISGIWKVNKTNNQLKTDQKQSFARDILMVNDCEVYLPDLKDRQFWINMLTSDLFSTIDNAMANEIVTKFNKNLCDEIINDVDNLKLKSIKNITASQIEDINDGIKTLKIYTTAITCCKNNIFKSVFNKVFSFTVFQIETISKIFDQRLLEFVFENKILDSYDKLHSFLFSENFLLKKYLKNIDYIKYLTSDRRCGYVLINLINEQLNMSGCSYIDAKQIYEFDFLENYKAKLELQSYQSFERILHNAVGYCIKNNLLIFKKIGEKEIVFNKYSYQQEKTIADFVNNQLQTKSIYETSDFEKLYHEFETLLKTDKYLQNKFINPINETQKEILKIFLTKNFLIINGGPGTGKSTIIWLLVAWSEFLNKKNHKNNDVVLLAPTGRAASRIAKDAFNNYQKSCKTIHSYVGFDGENLAYEKNVNNEDLIIIDEASMISNYLMAGLLDSLNLNSPKKMILIGDANQLECIGIGSVLVDLINELPGLVITLNKNYRSTKNINNLAYKINHNTISMEDLNNNSEITFYDINDYDDAIKLIENEYKKFLVTDLISDDNENKVIDEIEKIQVISATKEGKLGTKNLNLLIENVSNHHSPTISLSKIDQLKYRCYDKIICIKNNKQENISNGDLGYIKINPVNKLPVCCFQNNEIKLYDYLSYFELGYACTVHKSQGSEFDTIFLVIDNKMNYKNFINKRLIYTAITRAKKKIYIFANKKEFFEACKIASKPRNTYLKQLLKKDYYK